MSAPDDRTYADCATAPIHIPGTVQPFGVLFAFDVATETITAVSESVAVILERQVNDVLGRRIGDVVPELSEIVASLRGKANATDDGVFRASIAVAGVSRTFTAAFHRGWPRTLLELEPVPASPRAHSSGSAMLDGHGAFARMCRARNVRDLCDLMAVELQRLTGYDRAMVYRFDEDGSGEIFSEICAPHLEPFLGLRYPASDIPAQARALYLEQTLRYIADVGIEQSALVPAVMPDTGAPLDLSSVFLRSPAPVHLEYLRNMGVGATLVLSLIKDGALWGMLVVHNSVPLPCPPATRGVCDFLGMLGSALITGATELERVRAGEAARDALETIVSRLARSGDIASALSEGAVTLDDLIASDGFAIGELGKPVRLFGTTPSEQHIAEIVREVEKGGGRTISSSEAMAGSWPALCELDLFPVCGILFAPVLEDGGSFVAWFRNEKVLSVKWAGDPNRPEDAAGALGPRKSFALWREEVRGRSERWSQTERDAAAVVREHLASAQLRLAQAQLARLASHDALTGLVNRRGVDSELDRLAPGAEAVAALFFIDLDSFKSINDDLGHATGDEFLVSVAGRLSTLARPGDIVARFGGDEFVLLCNHCPPSAALHLAERILAAFERPFVLRETTITATASVGWALAKSTGDAGELIRRADTAMYYAKRRGGNQAARSRGEIAQRRRGPALHPR